MVQVVRQHQKQRVSAKTVSVVTLVNAERNAMVDLVVVIDIVAYFCLGWCVGGVILKLLGFNK